MTDPTDEARHGLTALASELPGAVYDDVRRLFIPVIEAAEAHESCTHTTNTLRQIDAYSLARMFHEAYERLAPEFNYKTRKASAVPWEDVPEHNKALMIATARAVLDLLVDGGGDG